MKKTKEILNKFEGTTFAEIDLFCFQFYFKKENYVLIREDNPSDKTVIAEHS